MQPFFELRVFPDDIHQAIDNYLANPAASSCTDLHLARALKKYDRPAPEQLHLEQLPIHATFTIKDGRKFKKGEKIRTRYRCVCLDNGHTYLFNPLADVKMV